MSLVKLYKYDLTNGMARQFSLPMTGQQIDAIWHTAIVVFGVEFYFDGGIGIAEAVPGTTRFGAPVAVEDLGTTRKTLWEFREFNLRLQMTAYGPNQYDLLRRNCNHYSDDAAHFLVGHGISSDVTEMIGRLLNTPLGQMMRPNLEMMSRNPNVSEESIVTPTVNHDSPSTDAKDAFAACFILVQCNTNRRDADQVMLRIIQNIIQSPEDKKFRKIPASSQTFLRHIASVEGCEDCLVALGFHKVGQDYHLSVANLQLLRFAAEMIRNDLKENFAEDIQWIAFDGSLPDTAFRVGSEGGQPLYFGRRINSTECGKYGAHLQGLMVVREGKEVAIPLTEVEFLCCPQPDAVVWVPGALLSTETVGIECAPGECVARARVGSGTHPAPLNLAEGKAIVPFGGKGVSARGGRIDMLAVKAKCSSKLLSDISELEGGNEMLAKWKTYMGKPIGSFSSLVNYTGTNRWDLPLSARAVPRTGPRVILCHDHEGGYLDGERCYSAPCSDEVTKKEMGRAFTFNQWHLIDAFIYFSHNLVTIPPFEWCKASHMHGVPIFGTFIVEPSNKDAFYRTLSDSGQLLLVAKKLDAIAADHCLDGWFFNIEVPVPQSLTAELLNLVGQTTKLLREHGRKLIWYDAVTTFGALNFQNALTQQNLRYFEVSDGIFTNYWWNPLLARQSAQLAGRRRTEVYMGIDVHGRNTFGGGKRNCYTAVKAAAVEGLSLAVFAPAWYLHQVKSRDQYPLIETQFWRNSFRFEKVSIPTISSLPFLTTFCSGAAEAFFLKGKRVSSNPWIQLSATDPSPNLVGNKRLTQSVSWLGDSALVVGSGKKLLFRCCLSPQTDLTLKMITMGARFRPFILLSSDDDPKTLQCVHLPESSRKEEAGWEVAEFTLKGKVGLHGVGIDPESELTIGLFSLCDTAVTRDWQSTTVTVGVAMTSSGRLITVDVPKIDKNHRYAVIAKENDRSYFLGFGSLPKWQFLLSDFFSAIQCVEVHMLNPLGEVVQVETQLF